MRHRAACLIRFMTIKKVELPVCTAELKKLLKPVCLKAVLLAIRTKNPSNLPKLFQTSCRILTARQNKKVDAPVDKQNLNVEEMGRLIADAALHLSVLKLSKLKDSSVCTLLVGRYQEVSVNFERLNYSTLITTNY